MCDPVVGLGVATFAMGAMQSIAGYQQQQAQYEYQKQVQDAQYAQEMQAYEASQKAYQAQLDENRAAAQRAYSQEQLKLKGEMDKARNDALNGLRAKLQAQGQIRALGRSGRTQDVLASQAEREYGQDLANLGTNLGYAQQAYDLGALDIQAQYRTANAQAAANRMFQPMKPMYGPPPSKAGMILGIGQAAVSGFGTYSSLKAPAGGAPTPKPTPKPGGLNIAGVQEYMPTSSFNPYDV